VDELFEPAATAIGAAVVVVGTCDCDCVCSAGGDAFAVDGAAGATTRAEGAVAAEVDVDRGAAVTLDELVACLTV
jgi:hypothetical protein